MGAITMTDEEIIDEQAETIAKRRDALRPFAERGEGIPRHYRGDVPFKGQTGASVNPALVRDYWHAADVLKATG